MTWTVLPHGPLEKVDSNLWRVEGSLQGMPIRRVMTVAKRSDGKLVVHSPIALDDGGRKELEALGPVAFVAVPSGYHRLDVAGYVERYPDARVFCPSGARARIEKVAPVAGVYDAYPRDPDVELLTIEGTQENEGGMLVRSKGGLTLVLNDVVFNMPHMSGVKGFVLKNITRSSGGPRVSRIARFFLVKDKAAFRAGLERLAGRQDLVRVIVSHHEMIVTDPGRVLREVAQTI